MKIVIDIPEKTYKYAKKYANSPILSVRDIDRCMDAISKGEIEQEPKQGRWIEEFNDIEGEVRFTCSCCGKYQLFGTDYCYHCGARMSEVSE